MPNRSEICTTVESYIEHLGNHDVDKLVGLFAEGAVQHEPLGAQSYRGLDEIRAFDEKCAQVPFSVSLLSPITVTGRFAAMQVRVHRDGIPDFAATDLFEFDENCKIVSLSVVLDPEARV
ncbi:steroid delta-isomerase [Rhodococcus sp. OK519]|nr:steroid delta-isomerase [Rhodococcus sp. OK519]